MILAPSLFKLQISLKKLTTKFSIRIWYLVNNWFNEAGKWDKNKNDCWDFATFNEKFFLFVQNYLLEPVLQRDMIDCSTSVSKTSKGCLGSLCSNLQSHLYAKNPFDFSHFQVTPLSTFHPKRSGQGCDLASFFLEIGAKDKNFLKLSHLSFLRLQKTERISFPD